MNDLRFALRQLLKAPGFTAVAVLTLGLGIGACTAIFTVVNGVLLRPFSFPEVERIVVVNESSPGQAATTVAMGKYVAWRAQAESFESLGALAGQSYNLTGAGESVHLVGGRMTASLLATLRLDLPLGRNFLAEEERPAGQEDTAILGHALWRTRFAGRPDILGQTIQLSGRPFTVVGVMPAETGLPARFQLFTPLGFTEGERKSFAAPFLHVLGRLKPGVTAAGAQGEMSVIVERLAATLGRPSPRSGGWSVRLTALADTIVGNIRPVLLALVGAVGFLLLIACANIGSLLLARATSRSPEFATRAALGASRTRLVRQLLAESLALSFLGACLGLLLARAGVEVLLSLAPDSLPRTEGITVDWRALVVTLAVAALSAVVFGLVPAMQASRVPLGEALRQAGRSTSAGAARRRLRRALVSGEVAIALILLAGAGLLMRSFTRLQEVNPGFNPRGAFVAETFLPRPQYMTGDQYINYAQGAMEEMAALPGVEAVAVANNLPFSKHHATYGMMARVSVPGALLGTEDEVTLASESSVSSDYFRAMGIALLRGRSFDGRDVPTGRSAIISQSVAQKLFPGEDPVGRGIRLFGQPPHEIVGVVANVRQDRLDTDASLQVYRPFVQVPDNDLLFVVRTAGAVQGESVLAGIRKAITRADPKVPVFAARPMAGAIGDSIARQQFSMRVFGMFSVLALLLAVVGIYGVMAYSVTQRTREIGLRMALGAQAGSVVRLVLSEGGRVVAIGVGMGVAGALLLSGFLEKLLFGVPAQDPVTLVGVAVVMALSAIPACLVPAWRASRVDPANALRAE
jgi:putative ABC transport system permease protein